MRTTLSPPGTKSYTNSIASYQIRTNKWAKHQSETAGEHDFPTTSWQNYNAGTRGKLHNNQCTKSQRNLTLSSTPSRSKAAPTTKGPPAESWHYRKKYDMYIVLRQTRLDYRGILPPTFLPRQRIPTRITARRRTGPRQESKLPTGCQKNEYDIGTKFRRPTTKERRLCTEGQNRCTKGCRPLHQMWSRRPLDKQMQNWLVNNSHCRSQCEQMTCDQPPACLPTYCRRDSQTDRRATRGWYPWRIRAQYCT